MGSVQLCMYLSYLVLVNASLQQRNIARISSESGLDVERASTEVVFSSGKKGSFYERGICVFSQGLLLQL